MLLTSAIPPDLPDRCNCPITDDVMQDPVVVSTGHSFERLVIAEWFRHNNINPITGLALLDKHLTPNVALRNFISSWGNIDCLKCPITGQLMREPVITCDGSSYERTAIEQHFRTQGQTHPITHTPLSSQLLIPNIAVRAILMEIRPKQKGDLEKAIRDRNYDKVIKLLKAGASITKKDAKYGKTPIQLAVHGPWRMNRYCDWKIVECIIDYGQGNDEKDSAAFGDALLLAMKLRKNELVKKLIKKEPSLVWRATGRIFAIHQAIQDKNYEILALLAVEERTHNQKTRRDQTPLALAISLGDVHAEKILIKARLKIQICSAITSGNFSKIREILSEHHDFLNEFVNSFEETPLMLAVRCACDVNISHEKVANLKSIIQYLLVCGADFHSAYDYASQNQQQNICALMLEYTELSANFDAVFADLETTNQDLLGSLSLPEARSQTMPLKASPTIPTHNLQSCSRVLSTVSCFFSWQAVSSVLFRKPSIQSSQFQAIQILEIIQKELDKVKEKYIEPYHKIDLYASVKSLLNIISEWYLAETNSKTDAALAASVKKFFAEREKAISNTSRDYAYSDSPANQLCYAVANIYVQGGEGPYDILLHLAKTEERAENNWRNYAEDTSFLPPHRGNFFRLRDNSIHLYDQVVDKAIANLQNEEYELSKIWSRSDVKGAEAQAGQAAKPLPLEAQELFILKQRSPSLARLVDYTIKIDKEARDTSCTDIYSAFIALRNGLYRGSTSGTGTEDFAGPEAEKAVLIFTPWWKNLNETVKNQIKNLTITSDYGEESKFGDLIDSIIGDNNCVFLKQGDLTPFLRDPMIKTVLNQLSNKKAIITLSDAELRALHVQILKELDDVNNVPSISINRFMAEPKFYQYLLSTKDQLEYKLAEFERFSQCIASLHRNDKERKTDSDILIQYIQTQPNNIWLEFLIDELKKSDYDYLRKKTSMWSPYFGHFYNSEKNRDTRTQTNQAYAHFERALSKKLVVNIKDYAPAERQALLTEHSFIKNKRFGYLGMGASATSSRAVLAY